ncbi:MAG TPA: hypothetical protein VNO22_04990 [Planctomycetota bacterium]|jgi:hypothetical protein|nr:hypothetical protein [Planctomycetota bacterium]
MKDEKGAQLNLREACGVGGSPEAVVVAPDGSKLFVLDAEEGRVSVVGVSRMLLLGRIPGALAPGRVRVLRPGGRRSVYCAGVGGELAIFDLEGESSRKLVDCGGGTCDLGVLPGERWAVLTVSSGGTGAAVKASARDLSASDWVAFPGSPRPGTLRLAPRLGLGAAVLAGEEGRPEMLAVWTLEPFAPLFTLPLDGECRALEFGASGGILFVGATGEEEVLGVDLGTRRVVRRFRMAGRPFGLAADPAGRSLWALCENLGHLAALDLRRGVVAARIPLEGVRAGDSRILPSPEGRLALVAEPAAGSVSLVELRPGEGRPAALVDRLELGRQVTEAAWSPFGDEVYVTDRELGAVLALEVDRSGLRLKDTDEYLIERLLETESEDVPLDEPFDPKNPLFPP